MSIMPHRVCPEWQGTILPLVGFWALKGGPSVATTEQEQPLKGFEKQKERKTVWKLPFKEGREEPGW